MKNNCNLSTNLKFKAQKTHFPSLHHHEYEWGRRFKVINVTLNQIFARVIRYAKLFRLFMRVCYRIISHFAKPFILPQLYERYICPSCRNFTFVVFSNPCTGLLAYAYKSDELMTLNGKEYSLAWMFFNSLCFNNISFVHFLILKWRWINNVRPTIIKFC